MNRWPSREFRPVTQQTYGSAAFDVYAAVALDSAIESALVDGVTGGICVADGDVPGGIAAALLAVTDGVNIAVVGVEVSP